jgi:membrane associated rhomboid family serine protease
MREASVGFQCPECVAAGHRSQRPARTAFGGSPVGQRGYVTKTLIAINALVLLFAAVSAGSSSALAGQGLGGILGGFTPVHLWGALIPAAASFTDANGNVVVTVQGVAGGEYYRLFTSMFLHYGLLHIGMNMFALWQLGRILEAALGPLRFTALYLVSGLGGSVAAYFLSAPDSKTVGASGAIFGLFGALVVVLRRLGRSISSIVPILVINLVITLVVPGISIGGHLGGLATGAAVGAGLAYAPRSARNPVQIATIAGALVVLAGLTLVRTAMLT